MKQSMLLAVLALCALTASATDADQPSRGWNSAYAEWNPMTFHPSARHIDNEIANGVTLGYGHAFRLLRRAPLYVEVGFAGQYSFSDDIGDLYDDYRRLDFAPGRVERRYDDDYFDDTKLHLLSLKVPVNFIYKWHIPNSPIDLMPYAGLSVRTNVWGKLSNRRTDWNPFSDDDMPQAWKRFQVGWSVGLNVRFYNSLFVGGSYGTDFNDIFKNCRVRSGSVRLGCTF